MRPRFESHQRRWTAGDVLAEIALLDKRGASRHMADRVLRILRAPYVMTDENSNLLLQALAHSLEKVGWGVVLHITDAAAVRDQVMQIARSHYYGYTKKHPEAKAVPFSSAHYSTLLER